MRRTIPAMIINLTLSMLFAFTVFNAQNLYAAQSPQVPLSPKAIPQFVQPLPTLSVSPQNSTMNTVLGNTSLSIRMCEFQAKVLPPGTIAGAPQPATWVWGYLVDPSGGLNTCATLIDLYFDGAINGVSGPLDTYIGPVVVSQRGGPSTDVNWVNELGSAATTNVLAYRYSTDQTLHWADPLNLGCMGLLMGMPPVFGTPCAENYLGAVPAVVHLHGGEVPPEVDGSPDSWFTSNGIRGHKYYSAGTVPNESLYMYPNTQEAGPLWFHDHTLGTTRLNVYAGLAGAYFIRDPAQSLPPNLHPLTEVVPLVIQDRMFDANGQLFFQADSAGGILWAPNPEHPYWSPEFVGDTIVVNGKAWPFLNVEAKRYRFLFLNGSNARAYEMFLIDQTTGMPGPPMWVIGTDGGYLDTPVMLDPALGQKLVMQPGERYEVIIDFTGHAGSNLIVRNTGRTPFPKGAPPQGNTLGRIVQFRVGAAPAAGDPSYDPASMMPIRGGADQIVRLADPVAGALAPGVTAQKTRELTLNEVMMMPQTVIDPVTGVRTAYPGGPLEVLVNNTKWAGTNRSDFVPITVNGVTTYYSELPQEGATEVWEVVNLTADAHPIHLHLVQFQLISRQNFNVSKYNKAYNAAFAGGVFIPAFGPPLDYSAANNPLSGGKDGGNPDITPYLQGPVRPPLPNEAGWKDTVIMYPGQVTRIVVRWAPTDLPVAAPSAIQYYPFDPSGGGYQYNYVWHCHIIDHEDNEMMRPDVVQLNPAAPPAIARPLVRGTHY